VLITPRLQVYDVEQDTEFEKVAFIIKNLKTPAKLVREDKGIILQNLGGLTRYV